MRALKDTELLQLALGLLPPWLVARCTFGVQKNAWISIWIFPLAASFLVLSAVTTDARCMTPRREHGSISIFSSTEAYLHARLPRTECPDCGVKTVAVPWAREGSGFTLLFEAFVMTLAKEMPVNAIARLVGEYDTRIWRILTYYVEQARRNQDYSQVQELGIDETSRKRGHNYITVFVDLRIQGAFCH